MSPATMLRIRFEGWCTIRIPTDPDPTDEPRGASGYTFAYAGEPDFDRLLRLQPTDDPRLIRPGAPWPRWGVFVREARIDAADGSLRDVPDLAGAEVRLAGEPRLENRNWVLTPPGKEPIVPFDLVFSRAGRTLLRREAPLDDQNTPFWQKPLQALMAQGAAGVSIDPVLVRQATGFADAHSKWADRQTFLTEALHAERDPVARVQLGARLDEVRYALAHPGDRRTITHDAIERFEFEIAGRYAEVARVGELAEVDASVPWPVRFWIGCWDFDLLAAYFQGWLDVPMQPPSPARPVYQRDGNGRKIRMPRASLRR